MTEKKITRKRKIMGAAWMSAPKRVPGTPLVTSQKPWATCPAAGRACRRRGLSERWIGGGNGLRASENATGYTNKAGDSPPSYLCRPKGLKKSQQWVAGWLSASCWAGPTRRGSSKKKLGSAFQALSFRDPRALSTVHPELITTGRP